jgi:uridine kinase
VKDLHKASDLQVFVAMKILAMEADRRATKKIIAEMRERFPKAERRIRSLEKALRKMDSSLVDIYNFSQKLDRRENREGLVSPPVQTGAEEIPAVEEPPTHLTSG